MAKPMYYWNGTAWEAVAPVVPQSPIAYQASAPSSPSTGDLWIDSDQDLDSYQRQLVRYLFNPSAGATSVSGVDANGATLSYTPGAEQVYLNGALLVRGSDYVATNGTSITSLAALSSGDVIEVFAYVAFNPANTYTQSQVDGLVGLVHLKTETFSAASTVSVNNVFSSTYDNYVIKINHVGTADNTFTFKLRASGSDDSTNHYRSVGFYQTSASAGLTGASFNPATYWWIGEVRNGFQCSNEIYINRPFETAYTTMNQKMVYQSGGTALGQVASTGGIAVTNSYDGFSLIPASGNITGTVTIYGYKD